MVQFFKIVPYSFLQAAVSINYVQNNVTYCFFILGQVNIERFGEVFLKTSVPFIQREKNSPGGE